MQNHWQPIETAPRGTRVDVYYVNDTFEPPVEGVLRRARLNQPFWESPTGSVPEQYVVGWTRPALL